MRILRKTENGFALQNAIRTIARNANGTKTAAQIKEALADEYPDLKESYVRDFWREQLKAIADAHAVDPDSTLGALHGVVKSLKSGQGAGKKISASADEQADYFA